MADNNNNYFEFLDIPDGSGGTERWYAADAEARAAIETLEPASVEAKADKVTGATNGNFAGLDSNGNLTDSGHNHSDYLTQHQSVTDSNPTLSWGSQSKVAQIGSTDIHVTMPANPNTDTSVTEATNHYTPSADNDAEITGTISGTAGAYAKDTEYTVLTGVKAQRDAKGHVVGITYTGQIVKDTNTTYSSMSTSVAKTGTSSTAYTITPANLRATVMGYVTTVSGNTPSQSLKAGEHYVFTGTAITSITVTFATAVSGSSNIYSFEFNTSSSAAPTLSVPSTVVWSNAPSIQKSKHYEVSIRYNASNSKYYGIITEF